MTGFQREPGMANLTIYGLLSAKYVHYLNIPILQIGTS